jgi:hypothetical protein
MTVEAYTYLYWENIARYVQKTKDACDGIPIKRVWIDCEEELGVWSPQMVLARIHYFADAIGAIWPIGIYTNFDFWFNKLGNPSDFSDLPLWFAHPNGEPNFDDYEALKIGGWDKPYMKQYAFDTKIGTLNCDLNVRYGTLA